MASFLVQRHHLSIPQSSLLEVLAPQRPLANCTSTIPLPIPLSHTFTILVLGSSSLALWIVGAVCLVLTRGNRAIRAAGVDLSACVLVAAILRVPIMLHYGLGSTTPLVCAGMVLLGPVPTCLTLFAITLKAFRIYRVLQASFKGFKTVSCTSSFAVTGQFIFAGIILLIMELALAWAFKEEPFNLLPATSNISIKTSSDSDSTPLSSPCFANCTLSREFGTSFLVMYTLTALVATYYTYRIRRFHKYFRQTRALALLIVVMIPSITTHLVLLYKSDDGSFLFNRPLVVSILHYAFLAVTVVCVLSPLTFGSLHRWCCGDQLVNNATDGQSFIGAAGGMSIGAANGIQRSSSVYNSSHRRVLFLRLASGGSSPSGLRSAPGCSPMAAVGPPVNRVQTHDASALISRNSPAGFGIRENRSVSLGARCAPYRPRRHLAQNTRHTSDPRLRAELQISTPTPTPARSPMETQCGLINEMSSNL